jgi:hypothetical protein
MKQDEWNTARLRVFELAKMNLTVRRIDIAFADN